MKIIGARITQMPKSLFDPMPRVYVTDEERVEHFLFDYYPDEISFSPSEFLGLEFDAARRLKFEKDVAFLRN